MRLEGKRALVVGGSQGIGKAIALAFAAEGADLAIAALPDGHLADAANAVRSAGRRCVGIEADVARLEDCARLTDEALSFLGGVDVLVNNVGGGGVSAPLHEIPPEAWDLAAAINLRAPAVCSARVIPSMLASGGGSILNITSTRGMAGRRNYSPYCATKAALTNLTRCMALDYADRGIRVNAIAPGAIETERSGAVREALQDPSAMARMERSAPPRQRALLARLRDDPEARAAFLSVRAPMGRSGTPREVAAAAVFLASDDASYVTGHIMAVDGGRLAGP